jgi:hypothetical protein
VYTLNRAEPTLRIFEALGLSLALPHDHAAAQAAN